MGIPLGVAEQRCGAGHGSIRGLVVFNQCLPSCHFRYHFAELSTNLVEIYGKVQCVAVQ